MLLRACLVVALLVLPLASSATTQITNVCDAQFCLASSPAACGGQCFLTAASGDSSVRQFASEQSCVLQLGLEPRSEPCRDPAGPPSLAATAEGRPPASHAPGGMSEDNCSLPRAVVANGRARMVPRRASCRGQPATVDLCRSPASGSGLRGDSPRTSRAISGLA